MESNETVQAIDRQGAAGAPSMLRIAQQAETALAGACPFLSVRADDNLVSNVTIRGAMEPRAEWLHGIFHNARYFIVRILPPSGRWYDRAEAKVAIEVISKGLGLPTFRKYTGQADKCLAKLRAWIEANR